MYEVIAQPDGTGLLGIVERLELFPRLLQSPLHGPVHEIQIQVVEAQVSQTGFKGSLHVMSKNITPPQFGGHEQLIACDTTITDCSAHGMFVLIQCGGINMAITNI